MTAALDIATGLVEQIGKRVNLTTAERERIAREIAKAYECHMPVPQTAFEFGANAEHQKSEVLKALRRGRSKGCTNTELNKLCFRYGARIYELRKEGYRISTERLGAGLFRFVLAPDSW